MSCAQAHEPAVATESTGSALSSCDARSNNNTVDKLLACTTLAGVRRHQAALQEIADENHGHRTAGAPGYAASVAYAEQVLRGAGYQVTLQPFQFETFISLAPSVLEQVSPPPGGPIANVILAYSGSGDVTAPVSALPAPPVDTTPGCEAVDFAGFPAGNIALISRGSCAFADKATHAFDAGASGVVIYNNVAGELNGTLSSSFSLDIPVTSVTQAVGQQLANTPGLSLHLETDTFAGLATAHNVIAESVAGDAKNVVMVGAHLDSVNAGPGINDNGSGAAAVLETAVQMAGVKPRNKVRFALWGAEESGLVGSTHYVNNLTAETRARIALYLNFDMIGSPNHVFFVYDGDDSSEGGAAAGPAGSADIEKVFARYYQERGIPFEELSVADGRSDHVPFGAAGVPFGGLFTGAEGIKTAEQASIWGGVAGEQYDPCYHLACDTYDNNNSRALEVNADAAAYATLQFAMNTQSVNGVRGKGNFKKLQPLPPEHPPTVQ